MKRLLIDLDACLQCQDCGTLCSYIQHPANNGIMSILEFAHFALICRRCEDSPCVASCPREALEYQPDNMLKRYMMRCTSCKSCSKACPFGVIMPKTIPFIIARCDYCVGRLGEGQSPICLESCTKGGLLFGEFEEKEEEKIFKISETLLIKTNYKWTRNVEGIPVKRKL